MKKILTATLATILTLSTVTGNFGSNSYAEGTSQNENQMPSFMYINEGFNKFVNLKGHAVFEKNSDGTPMDGVVRLTEAKPSQFGSIITNKPVPINTYYELKGKLSLGKDFANLEDGIAFMFVPESEISKLGDAGNGSSIGIGKVDNAFGFKLDTFYNGEDEEFAEKDPIEFNGLRFGGYIKTDENGRVHNVKVDSAGNGSSKPKEIGRRAGYRDFTLKVADSIFTFEFDGDVGDKISWTADASKVLNLDTPYRLVISSSTGAKYGEHLIKVNEIAYLQPVLRVYYYDKDTNDEIKGIKYMFGNIGDSYNITKDTIDGYSFVNSDGELSGRYLSNKEINLYYTKNVNITLNPNGGKFEDNTTDNKQISLEKGKTLTEKNPTKEDYVFKGWYTDKELTKPFDINTPINSDTTLYAKWEKEKVNVTLDPNGGKFGDNTTEPKVVPVEKGEKATEEKPTKQDHIFKGWYTDKEFTKPFDFNTLINSAITLYAKWEKEKVNVTLEPNGGKFGDNTTEPKVVPVEKGEKATEEKPTKPNYKFDGWYTDKELTKPFDFNTPINSDTTLYAKWEKEKVSLTLEPNGGKFGDNTTEPKVVPVEKGEKAIEERPTKQDHIFKGWYTDKELTKPFDFNTPINNDTTLYAKWEKEKVSLTLEPNGGKFGDNTTEPKVVPVEKGEKATEEK
ncbi:InlB B-repeat-containing protein, partial [Peptostreptococcus faecalis]|uniref:InlB B-repeat-containing protein n=1 Tax=Peptostreptococcus faecalis TaxID=2045015 RepID=UPI0015E15BA0